MDRRSFLQLAGGTAAGLAVTSAGLGIVSTVRAPEAAVSTFARFVTEDGVPGVHVA